MTIETILITKHKKVIYTLPKKVLLRLQLLEYMSDHYTGTINTGRPFLRLPTLQQVQPYQDEYFFFHLFLLISKVQMISHVLNMVYNGVNEG